MAERRLPRLEILARIRDAGRRNDSAAFQDLYIGNRVGLEAARGAWAEGRAEALRAEAEECGRAA